MNGGRITLTTSEQRRLIVLNHLESGALVNAKAARLLELSVRQLQRMLTDPKTLYPHRQPLRGRAPRARLHDVEAHGLQAGPLHTTAARREPPLAPSRRRLTMTNSLNRYGDRVTELRQYPYSLSENHTIGPNVPSPRNHTQGALAFAITTATILFPLLTVTDDRPYRVSSCHWCNRG